MAGMVAACGCTSPESRGRDHRPPVADGPVSDPMVSVDTLHPAPPDFARVRIGTADWPVPPYAKFLAGVRICLDPGHGGDAHQRGFKRGPTGVREAEMNLRVAQFLRDWLEHCGAQVRLTREGDTDLSLEDRARTAEAWGADLFVSCHHNAVETNPQANYTTVWYHAGVDDRPSNLDLARHLCRGLLDELALPQVNGVPLKSDQLMYKDGFAVLRHARVTAALCESSFFTNPQEEQRLRQPEYNLREAYGMFLGLARYAAEGLPRVTLAANASAPHVQPAASGLQPPPDGTVSQSEALDAASTNGAITPELALPAEVAPPTERTVIVPAGQALTLEFVLDDGLRSRKAWGAERQMILTDSIAVRLNGERIPHTFTSEGYRLTADLPATLPPGRHSLTVQFQNLYKNSVLNPEFTIEAR